MNPSPSPNTVTSGHILAYLAVGCVLAMVTAFEAAVANGQVPFPKDWLWVGTVLVAPTPFLTMLLPKVMDSLWPGQEPLAAPTKGQQALRPVQPPMEMR